MLCVLWVVVARVYSTFVAGTAIATRGSCVWLVVSQAGRIGLVQALVAAEHNLLQISYACTSPLLSDRFRFPTVRSLFRTALSGAECSVTCVVCSSRPRLTSYFCAIPSTVSTCALQFVRTVSTSKNLAPAIVSLVRSFSWVRCLVLYFYGDMFEVTASTWSHDLTAAGVDVQRLRTDELKADGRAGPIVDVATDPINEVLSKILLSLQRVVLVLAPTEVVRSLALAADAKGMVSAGWAWISDVLCARVDVRGDTAQAGFPIAADHGLARPFISVASFGGSIRRSAHALCGFACGAGSCAAHRPLPVRPCLHAYLPTCSHPHTLAQCIAVHSQLSAGDRHEERTAWMAVRVCEYA